MEALIDAVFSEGFAWTLIVLAMILGPTGGSGFKARHRLKAEAQRQQFELEQSRLELEQSKLQAKKPVCLCEHGANYHDRTGACTETVQRPSRWNDEGIAVDYENVACSCVDYTGPSPGITGSILGELNER